MTMKQETKIEAAQTQDGLTVEQALSYHEGWVAARKGERFEMGRGSMWSDGWITFHLLKDHPRSWQRH